MCSKPRRSAGRRCADAGTHDAWFSPRLWLRGSSARRGLAVFQRCRSLHHGLEWIHSPSVLAHPLDDGTAVLLERDFANMKDTLGRDAKAWRRLMEPFARNWQTLAPEVLAPVHMLTRHPFLLARFGLAGLPPANTVANFFFREERAKALFAGMAAHSFLSLNEPLSAGFGTLLGAAAHAVGWPIPRGGAQSITDALIAHLESLGRAGSYILKNRKTERRS